MNWDASAVLFPRHAQFNLCGELNKLNYVKAKAFRLILGTSNRSWIFGNNIIVVVVVVIVIIIFIVEIMSVQ